MHRRGLERFNNGGEARVLNQRLKLPALTKDGKEIPVELTITLVSASNDEAFVGFLRDISDQDLAERQAQQLALESKLMFELSALAAGGAGLDEAFQATLEAVCELAQWPLGHAYRVSDDGERLVSRNWSSRTPQKSLRISSQRPNRCTLPGASDYQAVSWIVANHCGSSVQAKTSISRERGWGLRVPLASR